MASTQSSSQTAAFNRSEVQDFLALRWQAAQAERPQVHVSSASTPANAASPAPKKSAWADAAAGGLSAAQKGQSQFAANLVKAAGDRRGPAA